MFELTAVVFILVLIAAAGYFLLLIVQKLGGKTLSLENMGLDTEPGAWRGAIADSVSLRSVLIALLVALALVPLSLVSEIVNERSARYYSVLSEISATWGGEQTLLAAVLVVPFTEVREVKENVTDSDGKVSVVVKSVRTKRNALFLPAELSINADLQDEKRRRGIFESLVYNADIEANARFDPIDVNRLSDHIETIHWSDTWIAVGLTDTSAIDAVSEFLWDKKAQVLSPGTRLSQLEKGFHAPLPALDPAAPHAVKLALRVKGSGAFRFAPFGEQTTVNMTSSWPHPSFGGDALPASYTTTDSGFTANWQIPHLARSYPQSWVSGKSSIDLYEFTAGVSMFETVSLYSQVTKAVKYGILFVGLTFVTLLIFELSLGVRIHLVQYILVGTSLCLFYLLLLSLSEHLSFINAFAAASIVIVLMISIYVGVVLGSLRRGLAVAGLLAGLYSILLALLRLEDYALLMGTVLLVFVVIVLMVVTRNARAVLPSHS